MIVRRQSGLIRTQVITDAVEDDGSGTTGTVIDRAWWQSLNRGHRIGSTQGIEFKVSGTVHATVYSGSDKMSALNAPVWDNATGGGRYIYLKRNNNATTPAASYIRLMDKGGTVYRIWVDGSGDVRIHTADPTNANDTAGTKVGAQT